jgi:peptidoglycan/xylan/chitin deacetylase (PgdA/CDA1 family)
VYLTYDDGPDPEITPILLDLLDEYQARATFFVLASAEDRWEHLIREIPARGHAVALHGVRHRSGFFRSNRRLLEEIFALREIVEGCGVKVLPAYRPPFGHVRPDTVRYLERRGVRTVLWTCLPGDFQLQDPETLFSRAVRGLSPGDIIALHDGTPLRPAPVIELTRRLLNEFRRRNWQSAMLEMT